jgi:integrase
VYLGRDPQTGKERRKWYSHSTRRDAEAHLSSLLTQIHGGGAIPTTKIRVGDYLDQWLGDYAEVKNLALTTRRNYGDILRVHLLPALGHLPLQRVSAQAIEGYLADKRRKGLSSTTVQYHFGILHEALGHAVRKGLLVRNPCDLVDRPRRERVEIQTLDEEQVRLFLAEAKRSSSCYRLYLTALLTGMRQGELLGLRWRDIDLTLGIVSVQQTFYRLGKQQLFKEPKSLKSRRTVALPPALTEELRSLRREQSEARRFFGKDYEDRDLVFCQPNGKPLHGHNITKRDLPRVLALKGLRKELTDKGVAEDALSKGLPRIRFHDLRHCHATHLLRLGVHPKIVQERLGHSTPAFTLQVYSHVMPGMQEEAARLLETHLLGHSEAREPRAR